MIVGPVGLEVRVLVVTSRLGVVLVALYKELPGMTRCLCGTRGAGSSVSTK